MTSSDIVFLFLSLNLIFCFLLSFPVKTRAENLVSESELFCSLVKTLLWRVSAVQMQRETQMWNVSFKAAAGDHGQAAGRARAHGGGMERWAFMFGNERKVLDKRHGEHRELHKADVLMRNLLNHQTDTGGEHGGDSVMGRDDFVRWWNLFHQTGDPSVPL